MDLMTIAVFIQDNPFRGGNPLAVFPDARDLSGDQMQAIARTMNLSESSFVTAARGNSYDVRIFTPREELPFAGHPTIGTAWVLRRLGRIEGDELEQRSGAGTTHLRVDGERLWFRRQGSAEPDLQDPNEKIGEVHEGAAVMDEMDQGHGIAQTLRLDSDEIGLEGGQLGKQGTLRPAFSDAGLKQLMIPLRDLPALERCRPDARLLRELTDTGAYCFTAAGPGKVRSRGFFAPVGIEEDPATGSAAAGLGIYLASRLGAVELDITQGLEMGNPSNISLKASEGEVEIGGRAALVYRGTLDRLP